MIVLFAKIMHDMRAVAHREAVDLAGRQNPYWQNTAHRDQRHHHHASIRTRHWLAPAQAACFYPAMFRTEPEIVDGRIDSLIDGQRAGPPVVAVLADSTADADYGNNAKKSTVRYRVIGIGEYHSNNGAFLRAPCSELSYAAVPSHTTHTLLFNRAAKHE